MPDVSTDEVFDDVSPGNALNAARLNNALASIRILPAFITGKTGATPAGVDSIVFYDASGSALMKCTFAELMAALGNPVSASTPAPRTIDGTAGSAAPYSSLPASVIGIRYSTGAATTDVAASEARLPSDILDAGSSGAGTVTLNCANYLKHKVTMTGNATFDLTNLVSNSGKVIRVRTVQDGTGSRTVAFSASGFTVIKVGGAAVASTAIGSIDLWRIQIWGSVLHVSVEKAFA